MIQAEDLVQSTGKWKISTCVTLKIMLDEHQYRFPFTFKVVKTSTVDVKIT